MQPVTLTQAQLDSVKDLSDRAAAKILGVGKSTVNKYRNATPIVPEKTSNSVSREADGSITVTAASTAKLTAEDALQGLRDQTVDLTAHSVSYGLSERELANGEKRYTYTIRATPKKADASEAAKANPDELIEAIKSYDFTPVIRDDDADNGAFVIAPSDMQVGKTSFNGGSAETVERVLQSFATAAEFAKEFRPSSIVIAELGDPLENFYSTSSQRETNDLDLTGQLRVARRLLLEGIKRLAPYAPRIRYASVPSNHGSVRVGFKAPAGDNHNDFGLEIAAMIEDAVRENPTLDHVTFHRPEHLYESMVIEVSGTKLGMVHGHQAGKAERLGEWWKGQDHGRQPTADADILMAGHFHSFRVQQSGNARWIMVSPASDPGSDWFTNITGEYSETGMLSFTTKEGMWENLRIL